MLEPSALVKTQPAFPSWLIALLLVLATTALFWPATRCDFVNYDDPEYVTENPHVQGGLSWTAAKWAFSNTEQAAYWAPLTWLSHMLAWQWFGRGPWGHHLLNVLLHTASTALVFLVFHRMTGARWRSLLLALLFGWHPLRVESVAWVTERKDTLSTFFWMLTLWAYVRFAAGRNIESAVARKLWQDKHRTSNTEHRIKAKKESRKWLPAPRVEGKIYYGLALGFFVCGLMSKAMLVTLPCALLLLDYWPLGRGQRAEVGGQRAEHEGRKAGIADLSPFWHLVVEKLPFFALAALAGSITFLVQKRGGGFRWVLTAAAAQRMGYKNVSSMAGGYRALAKTGWPMKKGA